MSRHDDRVSLRQMLDHARKARAMSQGRSRAELDSDDMLQLALIRLVEVIGEAAWRVGKPTRQRHPEIPWADIVSMRNRLIHGYDVVDLDLLWETVIGDLPPLIDSLHCLVEEE